MYSEKENKPEPETKERFIQTYLVISGLLLTALPDKGQFNEIVLSGFGIF